MPAASWRTRPARTMSLWLTASAPAGSSLTVGRSSCLTRMGPHDRELPDPAMLPKAITDILTQGGAALGRGFGTDRDAIEWYRSAMLCCTAMLEHRARPRPLRPTAATTVTPISCASWWSATTARRSASSPTSTPRTAGRRGVWPPPSLSVTSPSSSGPSPRRSLTVSCSSTLAAPGSSSPPSPTCAAAVTCRCRSTPPASRTTSSPCCTATTARSSPCTPRRLAHAPTGSSGCSTSRWQAVCSRCSRPSSPWSPPSPSSARPDRRSTSAGAWAPARRPFPATSSGPWSSTRTCTRRSWRAATRRTAVSSRSRTTRASRRRGGSCDARRWTNCRSSSTCCAVR